MKLLNTSEASCSDASVTFSRSKHTPCLPRLIPVENLPHGEPRKRRLDFGERKRESGNWHDAVCWQTKSSLKWGSNTQRCQFSCRTLDQPDYWLQQIKVIPEYQRRAHAGWPCRTPARWGRRRERPSFEKVFTGRKWRFVSASCTVRVSCGVRKLWEGGRNGARWAL